MGNELRKHGSSKIHEPLLTPVEAPPTFKSRQAKTVPNVLFHNMFWLALQSLAGQRWVRIRPTRYWLAANSHGDGLNPTGVCEAAPTACAVVICFASFIGSSNVLEFEHHREVCSVSGEVMLSEGTQPLSARLQGGIRFFSVPLSASPLICLAASLPQRGAIWIYPVPLE